MLQYYTTIFAKCINNSFMKNKVFTKLYKFLWVLIENLNRSGCKKYFHQISLMFKCICIENEIELPS